MDSGPPRKNPRNDLHICKNSTTSASTNSRKSSECDCGPEYVCVDICPEGGYSVSTLISWQHFPRSTSSRSQCDETEETHESISSSKSKTTEKSAEKTIETVSTEYPITKSFAQLNALHYLEVRHVFQLLNFLIGHLVCNEPGDPVAFLVHLLGRCLKYRDSLGEPPLLFANEHLTSVYNAFDPFERGHLTLEQYREAMKSLGLENSITPYNQDPPLNDEECVDKSNFIFEAERCLIENLKAMLRVPNLWEENRLVWQKKMTKKKLKKLKEEEKLEEEKEEIDEEETQENESKCSIIDFRRCSLQQQPRYEPEQLFLN